MHISQSLIKVLVVTEVGTEMVVVAVAVEIVVAVAVEIVVVVIRLQAVEEAAAVDTRRGEVAEGPRVTVESTSNCYA